MIAVDNELVLMANVDTNHTLHDNIWIADTGASNHMTNSLKGMYDLKPNTKYITVGNGSRMQVTKTEKWRGTAIDNQGNKTKLTLTNVDYVPELMVNLFSLTDAMNKDFELTGSKKELNISRGNFSIRFDQKIASPAGNIFGTTMLPNETNALQNCP